MKLPIVLATSAVVGVAALVWAQDPAYHIPAGIPAPNFEGRATDGKDYSLKSLTKDKPVFVVFWKERCPHNPKASALFNALNKAYEGKANLIGIVTADESGAKKWVEQFDVNYPLIPDAAYNYVKAYKMKFSIGTFQIGRDGKIEKVFDGYGVEALNSLNNAMASVAGTKPAKVDLSNAPKSMTWGCGY